MNIWIDILHIPQFNFYRPFITKLTEQGQHVYVTALGRGKLPAIVKRELSGMKNVSVKVIGKHRMTKWSALLDANALRIIRLFFWVCGKKIDVAFSNGYQAGIMGRLFRFPVYEFGDDPQVSIYGMMCRFATQNHSLIYELPEGQRLDPRDKMLPVLKEWAYLNPRTFRPNVEVLKQYGVKEKEYMFLREVSVGTINYTGQESGAILGIKDMIPKGMKVLLSLEEKKRRGEYPEDWILLQEPIEDIHSLIYYAAGLVSSGDSMAREAALMGVPAYYLGIRYTMPANKAASNVAGLQNRLSMPFKEWIESLEDASLQFRGEKENKNINNTAFAEINHKNIIGNQKSGDSVCCEQHTTSVSADSVTVSELPLQNHPLPSDSVSKDTESSPYENASDTSDAENHENSHADSRVTAMLQRQIELRKHIDESFIDINAYMLNLVENVGSYKR